MEDIAGGHVQVVVRDDGKVLWVNVNGVCALRVCRIESMEVDDRRHSVTPHEQLMQQVEMLFGRRPDKPKQ